MAIVATVVSAAAHASLIALGATLLPSLLSPSGRALPAAGAGEVAAQHSQLIDIELPAMAVGSNSRTGPPASSGETLAVPIGGHGIPRPDSVSAGHGGTDTSSQPAVNLADRDDGLRLARELANHLDRDQISRVRSARLRQSWDDERLTTNPMELTFVANGVGRDQERRPPAETTPSRGSAGAPKPSREGGDAIGTQPIPDGVGLRPAAVGTTSLGAETASAGAGIPDGENGADHRTSAASEMARPMVDKGNPSVPSDREGSPKDTVDSHQQVAANAQSLIDSSTAGGRPGDGPGGAKGPGATGSGGLSGPGSRSNPMGYGPGAWGGSTVDPRITAYKRRVVARISPFWANAFPRWAIAELRQGRVSIAFEILANGRVQNVRITRPSGIDEFDRNCVAAIFRASPFEPIPGELGMRSLRWELSFDAVNPTVR